MARRLELGARGWGAPARPIAVRGARGTGWGEGAPPRADLGAGIAVAAAGSRAGRARQALGWAATQAAARAGAPSAPPLRRVTFRRQWGLAREARAPGGVLRAPGRRGAEVPREEARGRKAGGRGGEGGESRGPAATRRRWRRGQRRAFPFPQIAIWRRRAGPERPREPR